MCLPDSSYDFIIYCFSISESKRWECYNRSPRYLPRILRSTKNLQQLRNFMVDNLLNFHTSFIKFVESNEGNDEIKKIFSIYLLHLFLRKFMTTNDILNTWHLVHLIHQCVEKLNVSCIERFLSFKFKFKRAIEFLDLAFVSNFSKALWLIPSVPF